MAIDYTGMKEEMIRALLKAEKEKASKEFELYRQAYGQIMPTIVRTAYDALTDEYTDYFSDGSARKRALNRVYSSEPIGPSYIRSTGISIAAVTDRIKSGEYVITQTGLAKSVAQFVEKPKPAVVEKSPEEIMDDALDAAVRAARKAV